MEIVHVVAALLWNDQGQFLICQRPAHKTRGLLWEFVGGKVEAGETAEEALFRECKEELGVTISVGKVFTELVHAYPDITIRLTLFHAHIADGFVAKIEHNDLRWIYVKQIPDFEFCPADTGILKLLSERYN